MTPFRIVVVWLLASLGLSIGLASGPPLSENAPRPPRSLAPSQDPLPRARGQDRAVLRLKGSPVRSAADTGPAYGTYAWPVRGPVIRGFEPPAGPYDPGHRGIDIAAPFGTDMAAAQDGVVAFAGAVAGALFISIDHLDGVRTTYSWLSAILVKKGDQVRKGQIIGRTGHGHPDVPRTHLHFGARVGRTYIDPMLLLERDVAGLIHLAPLRDGGSRAA